MSERLSDEQVDRACEDPHGVGGFKVAALAREVQERRAAERPVPASEPPPAGVYVQAWCGRWITMRHNGAHWLYPHSVTQPPAVWLPLPPAPAPPETTP